MLNKLLVGNCEMRRLHRVNVILLQRKIIFSTHPLTTHCQNDNAEGEMRIASVNVCVCVWCVMMLVLVLLAILFLSLLFLGLALCVLDRYCAG